MALDDLTQTLVTKGKKPKVKTNKQDQIVVNPTMDDNTNKMVSEAKEKTVAMLFGRMNPPTKGHEENIEGLKKVAKEHDADHLVVASRSQDSKKNPLPAATKEKHLKRAFPDTNIAVATAEHPTIFHHLSELHRQGYHHVIIAGGEDRASEYDKLKDYNGKEGKHGYYNFKSIRTVSTGERTQGVSGTDMRRHASSGNYDEFKKNLPSKIASNDSHAKDLYNDTRKGLGINEGLFESRGHKVLATALKNIEMRKKIASGEVKTGAAQPKPSNIDPELQDAMRKAHKKISEGWGAGSQEKANATYKEKWGKLYDKYKDHPEATKELKQHQINNKTPEAADTRVQKKFNFSEEHKIAEALSAGDLADKAYSVSANGPSGEAVRLHQAAAKAYQKKGDNKLAQTHREIAMNHIKSMMKEEFLDEAAPNFQTRYKRSLTMRRNQVKLARAREFARHRYATPAQMARKSQRAAKALLVKRYSGETGVRYQNLPATEKARLDKQISSRVDLMKTLVQRIYPVIRQHDIRRVQTHRMTQGLPRMKLPLMMSDASALFRKSLESGIPIGILVEVFFRGMEDLREGKTPEQVGFDRVNSFINFGKAFMEYDLDLAEEVIKGSMSYNEWLKKNNKQHSPDNTMQYKKEMQGK